MIWPFKRSDPVVTRPTPPPTLWKVGATVKNTARMQVNREQDETYTIAFAHEGVVVWVGALKELAAMLAERVA